MNIEDAQHSTILVVSDNPLRLGSFADYLRLRGFTVLIINKAGDVLKTAVEEKPDMIILDIFLPGVDSFETCRRLKEGDDTHDIPVMFMSALTETIDKVKGFEAGGVDYITRPFHHEEVLARMTAHLRIRSLQKSLQENNTRLEQEIQQRKQTEEALRESEERFKVLAESTFEGVIVHDKGLILDVNHVMEDMFNYQRSELIGNNALDLMMAEFREGILSNIRTEYENLTEAEGIRKDGTVFPVELQAKALPYQGRSVRVAAIRDVTWRKQAENALLESQRYIRNIIESSLDMIITVDHKRCIVEFNNAAQQVFGYSPEEVIGKEINMLYAHPEESSLVHRMMLEQGQLVWEVVNKRKNGEEFPCLLSASTLYDVHGEVVGYMGVSRDITERKKAQEELLAAHNELKEKNEQLRELNASKDKFFSIISHDMKNPFTILLGFSELLALNIDRYDEDRVKSLVKRIYSAAQKLYALLENLLTWAKIQRGMMECSPACINLRTIIQENIDLFTPQAEKKQITLFNDIQEDASAYADVSMVKTILRNLISNGLKFTSSDGSVRISSTEHDEHFIELSVSDTGIGISEDILSQLLRIDTQYTRVGTAGEEGTGLGLILCKELVEQNRGEIWVESKVGKGTTFRFTLPKTAENY